MKIYRRQIVKRKRIFCMMHWVENMRSFQIDDTMVMLIQSITSYIHPDWKTLIKGAEKQFLDFLNEEPFPWDVPTVADI